MEGVFFFFSSRRRHTRLQGDWSSDVCSSDLEIAEPLPDQPPVLVHEDTEPSGVPHGEIGRASCRESVDLGGRRIIKKKKIRQQNMPTKYGQSDIRDSANE